MPTNNPRGFEPLNRTGGPAGSTTHRYRVSANNPTTLFVGDPVKLFSGELRKIDTSGMSAGAPGCVGVVAAIYNSNGRPFTHNLPATPHTIPASTAGYADVYDDPSQLFLVNGDSALNQGQIGQFVRVTAGAGTTAMGTSGISIKLTDATAANVAAHQFRIMGLGPNERIGDITGVNSMNQANNDVVVQISDHAFTRRNRVTGTTASGASD